MTEPREVSPSDIQPHVRERILRERLAAWRDEGLVNVG